MPLFLCTKCGCIENTATSRYWTRRYGDDDLETGSDDPLCSECDPKIGKWHGRFPKRVPDPATVRPNKLGGHFIDIVPVRAPEGEQHGE